MSKLGASLSRLMTDSAMSSLDHSSAAAADRHKASVQLVDFLATTVGTLNPRDDDRIRRLQRAGRFSGVFARSVRSHWLDFDDSFDPGKLHPAPIIWPSLFAGRGISGRDLVDRYLAVVTVMSALTTAALPYENARMRRMFATQTFGPIVSALAAIVSAAPQESTAVSALGIAFMNTGGTKQAGAVPGGNARQMYPAFSAETGATAFRLAQNGLVGPDDWLDGAAGFGLAVLDDRGYVDRLGEALTVARPAAVHSIHCKQWACCRSTHKYLAALLPKVGENPDAVSITRMVSPERDRNLLEPRADRTRPTTIPDAKYSIPFVLAMASAGHIGLAAWSDERLHDEEVMSLSDAIGAVSGSIGAPSLDLVADGVVETVACEAVSTTWSVEDSIKKFWECADYAGRGVAGLPLERALQEALDIDALPSLAGSAIGRILDLDAEEDYPFG
jgi:2-methylcitrate dehydratase PrpD